MKWLLILKFSFSNFVKFYILKCILVSKDISHILFNISFKALDNFMYDFHFINILQVWKRVDSYVFLFCHYFIQTMVRMFTMMSLTMFTFIMLLFFMKILGLFLLSLSGEKNKHKIKLHKIRLVSFPRTAYSEDFIHMYHQVHHT